MKPILVIGLGNTLMGDDGIGAQIAERLAASPALPVDVEVIAGGTDLLRHSAAMEGRRRVIVIDAVQDAASPGTIAVLEAGAGLPREQAHHLSAEHAVELLRWTTGASITMLGVSVRSADFCAELSTELSAALPAILDRVLKELRWNSST